MSYKFQKTPDQNNPFDLTTVTIEIPSEVTADGLAETFREFLLACGYHPDSVDSAFGEVTRMAEELEKAAL